MEAAQRLFPYFLGGANLYLQNEDRINAAIEAGQILRQRYNRYHLTGNVTRQYHKPVGVTPTIRSSNTTRSIPVKRMWIKKTPVYSKKYRKYLYKWKMMPGRMPRRSRTRRFKRRRISKRARWQARARRQVGEPRNHSSSKTTESLVPGTLVTLASNTPSFQGLINIGATTNNAINDRQRYICNVSGVKLDLAFQNLAGTRGYVNWAIIHPKQGQKPGDDIPFANFFRRYTTTRSVNPDSTSGTGTQRNFTGLSYAVAQINTDDYIVLKRGKFILSPGLATTQQQGLYNYGAATKEKSIWCKIGRQFEFEPNKTEPGDQIYFVCWYANPNAGTDPVPGQLEFRARCIIYFREPRSY